MNAEPGTPSPPGAAVAVATLVLLIAASCGGTSEPEQVRTTIAPPAPVAEIEPGPAPAPPPTGAGETEVPAAPAAGHTGPAAPAPSAEPAGTTAGDPPPPPQGDARLRGSVTYRERIALTPGATLTVQLRDTSYADAASELIAEQVISDPGQVPIRFEVRYESGRIDPRNTYSIQARITEADGRLAFINDTAYDVITGGNPSSVDMVLVMVQPPPELVDGEWSPEDGRPVEEPVTVTGTELLWEGSDLFVRVTFVIADQDGCYRRGREEATVDGTTIDMTVTAWVPAPTPWAIDCSEETLELDAIAHVSEPLVSGQTYTITVNGETALDFTAP